MSSTSIGPRRAAAFLLLAAISGGMIGGVARAAGDTGTSRCEIRLSRSGGAATLTALAHADEPATGRYSLRVSGSGMDLRQGGSFEAAPGRPATLGTVTLGANGSAYRADLDLDLAGETLSCSKRIGGGR